MKLSIDFGRWTTAKTALAVAGSLAFAGAIGSAVAMSPIIAPPIKWQGGVEFRLTTSGSNAFHAYTVPAGRNFLLTDLVVQNRGGGKQQFSVYTGAGGACTGGLTTRIEHLYADAQENVILGFQTGIGFGAGTAVCLGASEANVSFQARGFLFTPN